MIAAVEPASLAASAVAGLVLGAAYFGGLWWTVRRMPATGHPLNVYFASLLTRVGVMLAVFYALINLFGWPHLLIALAGMVTARAILIRHLGQPVASEPAHHEAS